jgi:hypothetical protein
MSEDLGDKVDRLSSELQGAIQIAQSAKGEVVELEEELAHERKRRKELEQQVEKLSQDNEFVNTVQQNGVSDNTRRAAICLQTLARRARKGSSNHATMDANRCADTLNGTIHRTTAYRIFERAEELVDDGEVVWYQKEQRSSAENSRLILDLDGGELPAQVAGFDLSTEVSA